MLPISFFLQLMRDDKHDVLVLSDEHRRHFDGGVEGYSSSLLDTLKRIQAFAEAKPYEKVITYGTSMGGFPAIRAGLSARRRPSHLRRRRFLQASASA